MMTLAQLRHLVMLAETRSFSRAADLLHLTQPALSRSIRALEDTLGQPVFDRIGRRIEPTAFGEEVLRRARQLVSDAQALADWLQNQDAVAEVIYPGLASHPHHALAKRQMDGFGGMLSIRLQGGFEAAKRFCERLELFTLAESLGGVESLVNHPAVMTHASIPPARRAELGIGDELVRLSVGIEALADLRADVARALG